MLELIISMYSAVDSTRGNKVKFGEEIKKYVGIKNKYSAVAMIWSHDKAILLSIERL